MRTTGLLTRINMYIITAAIGETVRGYVDDAENDERFIHGGFYP